MTSSIALHQLNPSDTTTVAQALQNVLSSTYGLYLATHNYHWNVEGSKFVSLHTLFDQQYNELFLAIDGIAERIRALGDYALPFEGENILQISKMTSNALNKETDADSRANRMVQNLVMLHQAVISNCQIAKEISTSTHDDESENMMVERVTSHQRALWMLGSTVK